MIHGHSKECSVVGHSGDERSSAAIVRGRALHPADFMYEYQLKVGGVWDAFVYRATAP